MHRYLIFQVSVFVKQNDVIAYYKKWSNMKRADIEWQYYYIQVEVKKLMCLFSIFIPVTLRVSG